MAKYAAIELERAEEDQQSSNDVDGGKNPVKDTPLPFRQRAFRTAQSNARMRYSLVQAKDSYGDHNQRSKPARHLSDFPI